MEKQEARELLRQWAEKAQRNSEAAEKFLELTLDMQGKFITVFEDAEDKFQKELSKMDARIGELEETLRKMEAHSNRTALVEALQEILDVYRANSGNGKVLYKTLDRLVEYVKTRPEQNLTRDQILTGAQAW